jgi:hypothetical protein
MGKIGLVDTGITCGVDRIILLNGFLDVFSDTSVVVMGKIGLVDTGITCGVDLIILLISSPIHI